VFSIDRFEAAQGGSRWSIQHLGEHPNRESGIARIEANTDQMQIVLHDWEFRRAGKGQALRNLLLTHGVAFGNFGIADPCVSGEPLVRHAAERTEGPAEEYRAGAEGGRFNLPTSGNWPPGLRATDHKHAHMTYSRLGSGYRSFTKRR
jgi:hypothetical protein